MTTISLPHLHKAKAYLVYSASAMTATQTMTSLHSQRMQDPRYVRLVNLQTSVLSSQLPSILPRTSPLSNFVTSPKLDHLQISHASFDYTPSSPAWYVRSPPNTSRLQLWLQRKYYQYEVTWGPYVLTPGEKLITNSLVIIMLSLIAYGFTKFAVIRQAMEIITHYMAILVREGLVTLRALGELILQTTLEGSGPEATSGMEALESHRPYIVVPASTAA